MDTLSVMNTAGLFSLATVLGGMIFFAFILTPMVFSQLPAETSGPFIRKMFPVYSKVMGGLSLLSAALLWNTPEAVFLFVVFILFLFGWLILMPRINRYRDAQLAGHKEAKPRFNFLHKFSVAINSLQLTTVGVVFIRLII
jgi:hypothetical protein